MDRSSQTAGYSFNLCDQGTQYSPEMEIVKTDSRTWKLFSHEYTITARRSTNINDMPRKITTKCITYKNGKEYQNKYTQVYKNPCAKLTKVAENLVNEKTDFFDPKLRRITPRKRENSINKRKITITEYKIMKNKIALEKVNYLIFKNYFSQI